MISIVCYHLTSNRSSALKHCTWIVLFLDNAYIERVHAVMYGSCARGCARPLTWMLFEGFCLLKHHRVSQNAMCFECKLGDLKLMLIYYLIIAVGRAVYKAILIWPHTLETIQFVASSIYRWNIDQNCIDFILPRQNEHYSTAILFLYFAVSTEKLITSHPNSPLVHYNMVFKNT